MLDAVATGPEQQPHQPAVEPVEAEGEGLRQGALRLQPALLLLTEHRVGFLVPRRLGAAAGRPRRDLGEQVADGTHLGDDAFADLDAGALRQLQR
ncbi:MAG: hypothetical protein U1E33_08720 [Rhodospirillales bacterium]